MIPIQRIKVCVYVRVTEFLLQLQKKQHRHLKFWLFIKNYYYSSDRPQKDRMLSVVESSVDVTRRVMNTPSTNTWKRVNRKWNKRLSKKNKYGKYIWVLLPWVNHSPPKHNRWLHIHHHVGGFKHIVNVVISTMRNNKKFTIRTTN